MNENDIDDIFIDNDENNEIVQEDINSDSKNEEEINEVIIPSHRIRRRNEIELILHPAKYFKNAAGKRIVKERTPQYSYLCLKSGEEFYFKDEDSIKILLNDKIEPNKLIRNIISKVPQNLYERMQFLEKFNSEEESDEEESDEEDNSDKVKKRYFGNLKELVYEAYIKEWKLRFIFKRLINLWKIYKMNKNSEKEIDPITLSEPEKEVILYDWSNKKKFILDAKSLAIMIESKLMYQEYGFPAPMYPRNPKNNVELSYKQMVSIYYQLKSHGELRWGFTTLREYNFNKNRWHLYHKSALTMNAIKANISQLDNVEGREMLLDFIFAKMDELGFIYSVDIYNCYKSAMIHIPNHWYLEKFKIIIMLHFEADHFDRNKDKYINSYCLRTFKKHHIFLNDIRNKNIV